MRRAAAAVLALALAGCSRYADFQLPAPQGAVREVAWKWTAQGEPVLARGAMGSFDASDALNPSVLKRGERWLNYYSGFDGKMWHTALAESADGTTWTKRGVVISPEGWEGNYIGANGHAMEVNGEIWCWYQAADPPRIALARSRDGVKFTKEPKAVLEVGPRGAWDERGVADPYVVRFGTTFYMFYLGQDRARRQRLGVARSGDGVQWTKLLANPVMQLGGVGEFDERGLGEPAVWTQHGYYWMLYTGRDRNEMRRMGMARSRDGVRWEKLKAPIIEGGQAWNAKVVCDATVWPRGEGVEVWFGGGDVARPDERLNGQIGRALLMPADAKLMVE